MYLDSICYKVNEEFIPSSIGYFLGISQLGHFLPMIFSPHSAQKPSPIF